MLAVYGRRTLDLASIATGRYTYSRWKPEDRPPHLLPTDALTNMSATVAKAAIKTWSDGYSVRKMLCSDTKYVQKWYGEICPISCDLDVALTSYPDDERGFLIGEFNGMVVASALRIPVSEDVYYGSYYYVDKDFRGRGFGNRLRDEVGDAECVAGKMLCIDAHDDLEEMNQRHGYKSAFKVVLYSGQVSAPTELDCMADVVKVDDVDFEKLIAYDNGCFVRPDSKYRKSLLRNWIRIEGGEALVALDTDERIVGYGCRRPAFEKGIHIVGPLYADSMHLARCIMDSLLRDIIGDNILMSICAPNEDAVKLVSKDLKLKADLHMIRMHLNGDPKEYNTKVFALTSIDVCGF